MFGITIVCCSQNLEDFQNQDKIPNPAYQSRQCGAQIVSRLQVDDNLQEKRILVLAARLHMLGATLLSSRHGLRL